jgi:hypothetical protein
VDVFLGFLLSKLTWSTYHYYIKTLPERRSIIVTKFFLWFEGYGRPPVNAPVSLLTGVSFTSEDQPADMANPNNVIHPGDVSYV